MKSSRDKILMALVVLGGLAAAVLVRKYGGHHDPADNGSWYLAMFGLAFLAGVISPVCPWRWGIAAVVPQWLLVFYPEVSNLWPLAIVFMSVLIFPAWLCAWIGARLRRRVDAMLGRGEPPCLDGGSERPGR